MPKGQEISRMKKKTWDDKACITSLLKIKYNLTYSGATLSCLIKRTIFPKTAIALFKPSDRMLTVAFL